MNDTPEEIELRYATDAPAALEDWLAEHLWPADAPASPDWANVHLLDRYFDTTDRSLARAGYGARLRSGDGPTTVTLKSDIEQAGALHRRHELEAEATDALDPQAWPPSVATRLVAQITQGRPLEERFTIRQHRRVRRLQWRAARLQVSIDRLAVEVEGRIIGRAAVLEIELREGSPAVLNELDRLVSASGVARAEPLNKMQLAEQLTKR